MQIPREKESQSQRAERGGVQPSRESRGAVQGARRERRAAGVWLPVFAVIWNVQLDLLYIYQVRMYLTSVLHVYST